MSRVQTPEETKLSPEMQAKYEAATSAATGLPSTFQSLFANPQIRSGMAALHVATGQAGLEPWVTLTVALTVAHERDNQVLWASLEPLAREAGVSDAVIDGIAAGTAPRGLLPKEGIWVHFTKEVLQDKMRDSTWQSTTHLVGDEGAVALAVTACYYDMMARLNRTFGLDTA
jgi:4-carboxymuconolactone decarboxylase